MTHIVLLSISFLSLLLLVVGCSDDPSSVGKRILPAKDQLKIDTIKTTAVWDSNYIHRISVNQSRLFLGRFQSFEAITLLEFSGLSTPQPSHSLVSGTVTFGIKYSLPDTIGMLGVVVRKFLADFNPSSFTWDSLRYDDIGPMVGSRNDSTIRFSDISLSVLLDTAYIREMMHEGRGRLFFSSTPTENNGIILGLNNDTSVELVICVRDTLDSLLTFRYRPAKRVSVVNRNFVPSAGQLNIQGGIASHAVLQFDVSAVSKVGVSITDAIVELRIDTASSLRGHFASNTLLVNMLDSLMPPKISNRGSTSARLDGGGTVFKFDVRSIVQQWITGRPNYGIVVRASDEFAALESYVVYGANASLELRPKLIIKYTMLPLE